MSLRHRCRLVGLAAVCTAFLVLAAPAFAAAHTYVVNSTADSAETSGCESAPEGECTLRGAIVASNANPAPTGTQNLVNFDSGFDGTPGEDEIQLAGPLTIESPVAIAGNSCEEASAGIAMPCVGLIAPTGAGADLRVRANEVSIYDLAIGGGKVGIDATGNGLLVSGSWFGLNLAREAKGLSQAGILLGPGGGAVIGQDGDGPLPATEERTGRNVFTHSEIGISMLGASRAKVEGNYIGVGPDGKTAAGVSVGIQSAEESVPAEENLIGGELTEAQSTTSACDGPCNVIVVGGPEAVGIRLAGAAAGSADSPSGPTAIYGNYLGLSADGTTKIGEAKYGIFAGPTPGRTVGPADVAVGKPRVPESGYSPFTNVLDGGEVAVRVDHAEGFKAEENAIGLLPADTENHGVGPSAAAFELLREGVTESPVIARNTIFLASGAVGVVSIGKGSEILVNRIYFGRTAMIIAEDDEGDGNLIHGNLIVEPEWFGIEVENDSNVLTGNWMFEAGRAGIVLAGESGVYASHNRVGGDTAAEENRIEGCPEGAILIYGEPSDHNEVAGNWGSDDFEPGRGHPFIQLFGHSAAEPPNGGIRPPTIELAEESRVSGVAASGAKVRIFTKRTTDPGELQSLVATAVADSNGHWTATYTQEKVAPGTLIAATQTTAAGTAEAATSEVSAPKSTVADREEAGSGGGGGGSGGGSTDSGSPTPTPTPTPAPTTTVTAPAAPSPAPNRTAPEVVIAKGPRKSSEATTAKFRFKAEPAAGATFECKLDRARWAKCTSPKTYEDLKVGRHTFRVRALAGGLTGAATRYQFTVKP